MAHPRKKPLERPVKEGASPCFRRGVLPGACAALWTAVLVGTMARQERPFITPISLLYERSSPWAYNTILAIMAGVLGLCWMRWRRAYPGFGALGSTLGVGAILFLCLIQLPYPDSRWHDPVAIVAMTCVALHGLLAASSLLHPALLPLAVLGAIALLLALTGMPALIGAGEHLLLLASTPGILLCYGSGKQLRSRSEPGARRIALPFAWLREGRALLSGCLWMAIIVATSRLFLIIGPGMKGVLVLGIPCWLGGALASNCAWRIPDGCALRVLGLVTGLSLCGWAGELRRILPLMVLLPFGLILTACVHRVGEISAGE